MSLQLNQTTLAGNLGAHPTMRTTAEGTKVANFRVATNEYLGRDADGKAQYHTEWHQVVAWGPLAEAVARRLTKGSAVYIEGALRTRSYEDKNGDQRRVTEVKAKLIQFLDPRTDDTDAAEEVAQDVEVAF